MTASKFRKFVSPAGEARYAYLKEPSDKFAPIYKTDLIVPSDECADFCKLLDELTEAAFQEAIKENPKAKSTLVRHKPYSDELDENGDPTGRIVFKFKASTEYKAKDGSIVPKILKAFDAKAKPIAMPAVYSGSRLRVEFAPLNFYNASSKSAGISLRIVSVQILELVTFDLSGRARGYGEEENGYEGEPEKLAAALAATHAVPSGVLVATPDDLGEGAGFRATLKEVIYSIAVAEETPEEVVLGQIAGVDYVELIPYQVTGLDGTKRSPLIAAISKAKARLAETAAAQQDIPF